MGILDIFKKKEVDEEDEKALEERIKALEDIVSDAGIARFDGEKYIPKKLTRQG